MSTVRWKCQQGLTTICFRSTNDLSYFENSSELRTHISHQITLGLWLFDCTGQHRPAQGLVILFGIPSIGAVAVHHLFHCWKTLALQYFNYTVYTFQHTLSRNTCLIFSTRAKNQWDPFMVILLNRSPEYFFSLLILSGEGGRRATGDRPTSLHSDIGPFSCTSYFAGCRSLPNADSHNQRLSYCVFCSHQVFKRYIACLVK